MLQLREGHALETGDVVQNVHTNETITIEHGGPAAEAIGPDLNGQPVDLNDWVVLKSPSLGI